MASAPAGGRQAKPEGRIKLVRSYGTDKTRLNDLDLSLEARESVPFKGHLFCDYIPNMAASLSHFFRALSVVSQRLNGVDARGPASGDVAGQQSDQAENQDHGCKRYRVSGFGVEEQCGDGSR
jgi:hypothetical protein